MLNFEAMNNETQLLSKDKNSIQSQISNRPLTMQYLGGKSRIVEEILCSIESEFPHANKLVDIFSGSGVVAHQALDIGYDVVANDIQPYSFSFLSSLLSKDKRGLSQTISFLKTVNTKELFKGDRKRYLKEQKDESRFFEQSDANDLSWEAYKDFTDKTNLIDGSEKSIAKLKNSEDWTLFLAYYRNTYFGVRQCAEIDFLREYSESVESHIKKHILAATVSAMTHCVSSTTHLAQFLKPNSEKSTRNLIKKRSISIINEMIKRLEQLKSHQIKRGAKVLKEDFRTGLQKSKLNSDTVVYADPPYFKEHYSRYYHVLDTFVLYDYPMLTFNPRLNKTTVGRYRDDRIISDFGKKAKAKSAFDDLIDICMSNNSKLAISYACSSIVDKDYFTLAAKQRGLKLKIKEFDLKHTGQGQARHKDVTEYLFLISKK